MTKKYFIKNFSEEFTHYFSTDKVVGLPNKVRRDEHKVPSHETESEKSLKVKKSFTYQYKCGSLHLTAKKFVVLMGRRKTLTNIIRGP